MKLPLFLTVVLALGALAQTPAAPGEVQPAPAQPAGPATLPNNKVVLSVGDQKVTAGEFETFVESIPEQYREQARGPMKRQLAEQIVRVKLLASEARQRGLDKDAAVQSRIALNTENLLAGAAFADILNKIAVDDASIQKYYDEHKGEYESVAASHILIKFKGSPVPVREGKQELSEEEALTKVQAIRKRLEAGEDFAEIAKAESDDMQSGEKGGALGTFQRGQMVKAFEDAAFSLPVNQVSDPVKTQFGYHLIRVSEHESKTLDEVRPEIEQKLKPELARQSVEQLRQGANVEMDEAFFGPAKPEGPAAGSAPVPPGTPSSADTK